MRLFSLVLIYLTDSSHTVVGIQKYIYAERQICDETTNSLPSLMFPPIFAVV